MSEQNIYGAGPSTPADPAAPRTKIRTHHLQKWKAEGHKWAMLTAYDYSTARVFDDAGIPVLLIGDSAANVVYGYDTTVPISVDELIPLVRGVARGARTHWWSPTCRSAATRPDPPPRWPRPPGS
ncbi:hypothetical protein NIIDMKKI_27140 [Mycobacterium kansasii]|uniref:3-methyl-2-oxobutanoate hydroxymethyltransferase n=1 Tax=Mycobacterium kansasii TaxID=1768 RepID=A0A7G1IG63_MYCKA|nr:hypothetical protein NIIDMKKI_27140 [Mycobacterium kansasii]